MTIHHFASAAPRARLLSVAVFVAGLAGMSPSHALVVIDSNSGSSLGPGTKTLTLDKFDPSLGELTAVQVSGGLFGQAFVQASDSCREAPCDTQGSSATGTLIGTVSLMAGSVAVLDATDSDTGTTPLCIDGQADGTPATCKVQLRVSASDEESNITDPTLLAWFTGPGTFAVSFELRSATSILQDYYRSMSASVRYTYDVRAASVPEPSTIGLVLIAVLGLVLGGHRGAERRS